MIYNDSRGGYIDNVPAPSRARTPISAFTMRTTDRRRSGVTAEQWLACRPALHQQQQHRGQSHQSGHLPGHSRGGAVPDQRRLERAADADRTRTWIRRACSTRCPTPRMARRCSRSRSRCSTLPTTRTSSRTRRGRVNGKLGDLKVVYTGGYLVRNVDQVGDYTNYARGVYADYYQCYGPGSDGDATLTSKCFSPSASWQNDRAQRAHAARISPEHAG